MRTKEFRIRGDDPEYLHRGISLKTSTSTPQFQRLHQYTFNERGACGGCKRNKEEERNLLVQVCGTGNKDERRSYPPQHNEGEVWCARLHTHVRCHRDHELFRLQYIAWSY
ncbi:hypothetical protein LXL04_005366 [Taraxacum kok-saghyz]